MFESYVDVPFGIFYEEKNWYSEENEYEEVKVRFKNMQNHGSYGVYVSLYELKMKLHINQL